MMLVPRPQPLRGDPGALLRPLQLPVWLGVLAALAAMALVLEVTARLRYSGRGGGEEVLANGALLEALGVLLATSCPDPFPAPQPPMRRRLLLGWNVAGVLLVTAYTSGLLSHLTAPYFSEPVDTIEDFLKAGLTWGFSPPYVTQINYDFVISPQYLKLKSSFIVERQATDRSKQLSSGRYAIIGRYMNDIFWPVGDLPSSQEIAKLRLMEEPLSCHAHVLGYHFWSELSVWADRVTQILREGGIIRYWTSHLLPKSNNPVIMTLLTMPFQQDLQPLSLKEVAGVLGLLGIGLSAATVVFLVEVATPASRRAFRRIATWVQSLRLVTI